MAGTGVAYLLLCFKVFPGLRQPSVSRGMMNPLFSYGKWVTLCSVLIPVLIYTDRLFIGALLSVAALAYYSASYELASRLQIFPWSFGTTLFPAFSTVASNDREELGRLYARSLKWLLLVMGPITLVVVAFASDILRLWVGNDFAIKGSLVLQILGVGMLLNALAQMPANLVDAVGRPDVRAKLFLSYAPVYLGGAWFLISRLGIVGAALGWTLRAGLELGLFLGVSYRLLRLERASFVDNGLVKGLLAFAFLALTTPAMVSGQPLWIRATVAGLCLLAFALLVWRYVLDATDKRGFGAMLPRLVRNPHDALR